MTIWRSPVLPLLTILGLVALIGGIYALYVGDRPEPRVDGMTDSPGRGGLSSLPVARFDLKPGTGQGLVQAYCTACHSLAPIVRHDGFTAEVWASEVQKMRKTYGCPIDDDTSATITTYLQTHYTATPAPPRGTFGPAGGQE